MALDINDRLEIKQIVREALKEHDKEKLRFYNNSDSDLITTTQAYKLRGRYRVTKLIKKGHLDRVITGEEYNSRKYISKKQLISLDKLNLK